MFFFSIPPLEVPQYIGSNIYVIIPADFLRADALSPAAWVHCPLCRRILRYFANNVQ